MWKRLIRTVCVLFLASALLFTAFCSFTSITSCSYRKIEPGIMLTFDDKEIKDWYSVRDVFNKYHAKVTFFITRPYLLTEEELDMMNKLKEDGHEFGSHGYDHKNAIDFLKTNSLDDYINEEVSPSIQLMTEKGFAPTSFSYPFGARTKELDKALLKYFLILRATVATTSGVRIKNLNKVYFSQKNRSKIINGVGIDDSYGNTLDEIIEGMDRAKKNSEVLILYSHAIREKPYHDEKYVLSSNILEAILKYAAENNLRFYTASEVRELVN